MDATRIVHFEVENHGSVWLFRPLTVTARNWTADHCSVEDGAQWFGDAVAVEHRFIGAIIEGAAADGLRVRVY